jgi:hypothetical protein
MQEKLEYDNMVYMQWPNFWILGNGIEKRRQRSQQVNRLQQQHQNINVMADT